MAKNTPSVDACLQQAIDILNAKIEDEDTRKVIGDKLMRARQNGVSQEQLEDLIRDVRFSLLEEARTFAISEMKFKEFSRTLDAIPLEDRGEALVRFVMTTSNTFRDIASLGPSLESRVKTRMGEYSSIILNDIDKFYQRGLKARLKELFGTSIYQKDMGRAMVRMILDEDYTIMPGGKLSADQIEIVKTFAAGFRRVQEIMEASAREAGIPASFSKGYWFRNYSLRKLRALGEDGFADRIAPRLDPEKHSDPEKTARHMYQKYIGETDIQSRVKSSLTYERQIQFASAADEYDTWVELSDLDAIHTLVGRVEAITLQIEAAQALGPMPVRNFERLHKQLTDQLHESEVIDPATRSSSLRSLSRAQKVFNDMMAIRNTVTEVTPGAHLIEGLKGWWISTVFAMIPKWHVMDSMQVHGRLWSAYAGSNQNFSASSAAVSLAADQFATTYKVIVDRGVREDLVELSTRAGFVMNAGIGAASNRFGIDSVYPFISDAKGMTPMASIAEKFHERGATAAQGSINLFGSTKKMQVMQAIAFSGLSNVVSVVRDLPLSDIATAMPELGNRMKLAGLTDEVWDSVRSNEAAFRKRGWGREQAVLLDVYELDDADRFVMNGFLQREAQFAIHNPSAYTKAMTRVSPDVDGTFGVKQSMIQSLFQFWTVPLQASQTVFPSAVPIGNRKVAKGLRQEHLSIAGRGQKAAMIVAPLMVGGAAMAQLNEVLAGREPYEFTDPELGVKAMANSSALPFLDQMLLNMYMGQEWGNYSLQDTVGDVVVSAPFMDAILGNTGDFLEAVGDGDPEEMAKSALKFIPASTVATSAYGMGQIIMGDAEPKK